jgi:hypothetical protein
MDRISDAARHAGLLVRNYGYSWKEAIQESATEYGVYTEDIRAHLESFRKEQETIARKNIQAAADYARDLAVKGSCNWGLAMKFAADEYDVGTGDISKEFAARRAAREARKAVNPWVK